MHRVRLLNLPGFTSMNQYIFEQLFFDDRAAIELYAAFKEQIYKALEEKRYFPVMRMCDGEYRYCVGKKRNSELKGLRALKFYAGKILKREITSWGETYTRKQNRTLKMDFPGVLNKIASHGVIANHFLYSDTHFCEEYIEPMKEWYLNHNIKFSSKNFTAFYFVYVLLNGPDSLRLFDNRNILILSSFDEVKCEAVRKELKRRGAANVYFESISKTQSMLDKPDLTQYAGIVDLALIAGGIGSANILLQCQPLNIVCIDSGFCLECIADKNKRSERVFCIPDNEF